MSQRECVEIEGEDFFYFSLFASLSDLRKSDHRFLSRAMRGHQNLGVSSKSTR